MSQTTPKLSRRAIDHLPDVPLRCGKPGARFVAAEVRAEAFAPMYFKRFIENLPAETVLVAVDYHV